jgi:hypothetical protein
VRFTGSNAGRPLGARAVRPLAALNLCVLLALVGCGAEHHALAKRPVREPAAHRSAAHVKLIAAVAKSREITARVDASSDRVLAEGMVQIAPGALSDAEVKRELRAARKAGVVLPSGNTAESFADAGTSARGYAAEVETPEASWNPRLKPIAGWIVPVLQWAYLHGWTGTVTSGYRTYYEQRRLNAAGAFSAPAGSSNHETTAYPGGAVDVTNPSQLIGVLHAYPGPRKLVGGVLGPIDPEHFSATGD